MKPTFNAFLIFGICLLIVIFVGSEHQINAQQVTEKKETTPSVAPAREPTREDERYRIGPGDLLDVRIFNRPQLSRDAVRVDAKGVIRMPLIEEDIQAACLTESELAKEVAQRYRKYQRNPQVDVFVKEYNSQPVAVIGAVDKPGRF